MDVDPVLLKALGPPMKDRQYWVTLGGLHYLYLLDLELSAQSSRASVGERGSDDHSEKGN